MTKREITALFAVATLGLYLTVATSADAADSVPTVSAGPPSAEETFIAAERARFGFSPEIRAVRLAAQASNATENSLGIPLTSAEASQLRARDAVNATADVVTAAASRMPGYSGIWLETHGWGAVHVSFTRPLSADRRQRLQKLLPSGGRLVVDDAAHTADELNALADRIVTDMPRWAEKNMTLATVGVDPEAGMVDIEIATDASPDAETAIALAYGTDAVAMGRRPVDEETGLRNIRNGPLYGGEWITGPRELCTMGYAYMINDQGQYYSVSAGHCNPNGSNIAQGYQSSSPVVGQVHANASREDGGNTYCDCAAIGPLTAALTTNQVLVNGNAKYTYTQEGSYTKGQQACHTGARSFESNGGHIVCGTITNTSLAVTARNDVTGGTQVVLDSFETNAPVMSGDSGSPFGSGPMFLGIENSGSTLSHGSKTVHMYLTMHIKPRF